MQLVKINTMEQYSNIHSRYFVAVDGTVYTSNKDNKLKALTIDESKSNKTLRVNLRDEDGNLVHSKVATIVANAFCIKSGVNLKIDYIDGDKRNLAASNLQWISKTEVPTITDEIADKWIEELKEEVLPTVSDDEFNEWLEYATKKQYEEDITFYVVAKTSFGDIIMKFDEDLYELDTHIADAIVANRLLTIMNDEDVSPYIREQANAALFNIYNEDQYSNITYFDHTEIL